MNVCNKCLHMSSEFIEWIWLRNVFIVKHTIVIKEEATKTPHFIVLEFVSIIKLYCIFLEPTSRWCPRSSHFLTIWVSRLLGRAQVSWATVPVLVSIAFSPSSSRCFFHPPFTCHWISSVFLLYDRCICTHSIDPSLTDSEFPCVGLALVPDVVVPEMEHGVRMKQKSSLKFLPWLGFEPRTS